MKMKYENSETKALVVKNSREDLLKIFWRYKKSWNIRLANFGRKKLLKRIGSESEKVNFGRNNFGFRKIEKE
jgi:hypothetical protein